MVSAGFGPGALTDISVDPAGHINHDGSWQKAAGGGWIWEWGANPTAKDAKTFGSDKMTDPSQTPNGEKMHTPPPPDVTPPDVTNTWSGTAGGWFGGGAPDIIVDTNPATDSNAPSKPFAVQAYMVSPGSIRDAENALLGTIRVRIGHYNALRATAQAALGENLFSDTFTKADMTHYQDQLLLQIGDVTNLVGNFNQLLNQAAHNYAQADYNSTLPQS